jgi:hypothetical protein
MGRPGALGWAGTCLMLSAILILVLVQKKERKRHNKLKGAGKGKSKEIEAKIAECLPSICCTVFFPISYISNFSFFRFINN